MFNQRKVENFQKRLAQKTEYPIGTVAYFGPDDKTITKMLAAVLLAPSAEPLTKTWQGEEVTNDAGVAAELGLFFRQHGVHDVVMTDGAIGCPHLEGVDYPVGEKCPHCPYWHDTIQA